MSLKDDMAADMAVFLNPSEFAETHAIDGKPVACVIDSNSDGEFAGDYSEAVYMATRKLYARESDLAKVPIQGKAILVDGKPFVVLSVSREMGMLEVTLTENST